jgi:hypothetical protein
MTKTVIEVVYGKYAKYEIVKDTGFWGSEIKLYKDGKYLSSYDSVSAAVDAAKKKG